MKENRKLLQEIITDIRRDMTDEEVLNLLADSKISVDPNKKREKYTVGQRAADAIAKFAGSWAFIFSFSAVLVLWMIVNILLAVKAFDPYPFILLNLVLSCVAAIQAPLIMMSQNRQEEKDRRRAENDYKVNLKTEATTVNGWLTERAERIPEEGYSFDYQNLTITVTKADEFMTHEITVKVHPHKTDAPEESEEK